MASIAESFQKIFSKAGVDAADFLKTLEGNEAIRGISVPDELISKADQALMTLDGAKQNIQLKSHFKAIDLSPVDKQIEDVLDEFQVEPEDRQHVLAAENSYKRIKSLAAKLVELEGRKSKAATGDKKVLTDEIAKLNAQVVQERAKYQGEMNELKKNNDSILLNMAIDNVLNGYTYTDSISSDAARAAAKDLLFKQFSKDRTKPLLRDGQIKLVNTADETLAYMINNQEVDFKPYTDKLVADNKLLKVSGTPTAPIDINRPRNNGEPPEKNKRELVAGKNEVAGIDAQLAAFEVKPSN